MAEPTLLDWSQLQGRIKAYRSAYGYEKDHMALTHVVLEQDLGLTPEEILDASTDGQDDRGIDAVYIDEDAPTATIHLYQVKCVDSFESSNNNFPSNEIDKVLSYLGDLYAKNKELKNSINGLLWEKTQAIWGAFDQGAVELIVHFCGNQAHLKDNHRSRMVESLTRFRAGFTEHTLSSIAALIIEQKSPQIDRDLRFVDDQYFERVDGHIRGVVATIEAKSLIELIRDPDDPDYVMREIFDDNVRVYLTTKNEINKRIVRTALSEGNRDFWYLNNGITMTCDSISYHRVRAPLVKLQNLQIVNGGQTSNALFEAYRTDPERIENVLLLVRIYETKERAISQLIAETTNSQTPVRSRDLRSNDDIQKRLEEAFLGYGYYYERKFNQHKEQERSARIDALAAGQAYVAYHLDLPDVGKKDKRRIFGDLYHAIFNDSITPTLLLTPFLIHAHIDSLKRAIQGALRKGGDFDTNHIVLIDGAYHVLYTTRVLLEQRDMDENDHGAGIAAVTEAIDVVSAVSTSEYKKDPETFALSRFFKDRKTTNKIRQAASERARQMPLSTPTQ